MDSEYDKGWVKIFATLGYLEYPLLLFSPPPYSYTESLVIVRWMCQIYENELFFMHYTDFSSRCFVCLCPLLNSVFLLLFLVILIEEEINCSKIVVFSQVFISHFDSFLWHYFSALSPLAFNHFLLDLFGWK